MGLLSGKTALVTGAARGIGKAVAMKFASEGANIAFTDLVLNDDMAAGLEATRKAVSYTHLDVYKRQRLKSVTVRSGLGRNW